MISTFLAEHAPVVRVAFWLVVIVSLAVGWLLFRLRARTALFVLAAIGLFGAVALTMTPNGPRSGGVDCTVAFSVPFQGIETLANVAMLLPLSLFVGLATKRPLLALLGASGFSAVIELVQALMPVIGRACDTNDWFMNSVGAVVGSLGAFGILALDRRRKAVEPSL